MKKLTSVALVVVATVVLLTQTGCFGSFALTKKVYQFNKSIGDKWVREGVFLVMYVVPVYGASVFIDAIILNSIEFWTGSNPVAMNKTDKEVQYVTNNGTQYRITATQNQFEIKNMKTNEIAYLVYNDNSWYVAANGKADKMATINNDVLEIFKNGKLIATKDLATLTASKN